MGGASVNFTWVQSKRRVMFTALDITPVHVFILGTNVAFASWRLDPERVSSGPQ